MSPIECEIAIIGAGVAGLAATAKLSSAGKSVVCLEAGNRIGGRILTVHDPLASLPIELGAEFIHGAPPETFELIHAARLTAYEHTAKALHIDQGHASRQKEAGELAYKVLDQLAKSSRKTDESFDAYLSRSRHPATIKNWARRYVESFNAARGERISVASLKQDAKAADQIDGDRSFRLLQGYDSIPAALLGRIPCPQSVLYLNSVVEQVKWSRDAVEVAWRSSIDEESATLKCRQLVVTVPLGVLQGKPGSPGAIQFDPEPSRILKAAAALEFGHVYRVTFRFRTAFWEENEKFKSAGFLISNDSAFSAWWTTHPVVAPILTAWCAGSHADQFQACDAAQVAVHALQSLRRILKRTIPHPEAVYFHDWQADPFFRGAYSYTPAGALTARKVLATPLEDTLFFAGEASETKGDSGTVHGAIASGLHAADLILKMAQ